MRLLHHAAAQGNLHPRVILLPLSKLSQPSINLQIRVFPHGTGIIDDKVGILTVALPITDRLKDPLQLFGVTGVHLTAEGNTTKSQGMSQFFTPLFYQFSCLLHKIVLPFRFLRWSIFIYFFKLFVSLLF